MKTARCAFPTISRALLLSAFFCLSAFAPRAFGEESKISILSKAPLSLPRLAPEAQKLGKKPVRDEAFEVLSLSPGERAKQKTRGNAAYLEIEPEGDWQQTLRNRRIEANYVSFTLNASLGTWIDVGGATLLVNQSTRDAAYAAIETTNSDKKISHEMPWMLYNGARMFEEHSVDQK